MSGAEFFDKPQERLHVYRLPDALNAGYCFGGANPIPFLNVDFFDVPWDITSAEIKAFIGKKPYFDPTKRFLVLSTSTHPTLTFTIEPVGAR